MILIETKLRQRSKLSTRSLRWNWSTAKKRKVTSENPLEDDDEESVGYLAKPLIDEGSPRNLRRGNSAPVLA